MSAARSSSRFRIRLEDGSEVPVASVEALARRIERYDILPDTPLYDGSTDEWGTAGTSSVVRFILEEMEREGYMLPEAWANVPPLEAAEAVEESPQESATPAEEIPASSEKPTPHSEEPEPSPEEAELPAEEPAALAEEPEPPAEESAALAGEPEAPPEEPGELVAPTEEIPEPVDEAAEPVGADEDAFPDFGLTLDAVSEDDEPEPPAAGGSEEAVGEAPEPATLDSPASLEGFTLTDEEVDPPAPSEPEPIQLEPAEPGTSEAEPIELDPAQPEMSEAEPIQPEPAQPETSEAEPIQFEPAQPEMSEPEPAEPPEEPTAAEPPPPPPRRRAPKDPWGHEVRDSAPTDDEPVRLPEPEKVRKRRRPLLLLALLAAVGLSLDQWGSEWLPGSMGARSVAEPALAPIQGIQAPPPPPELEGVADPAMSEVAERFREAIESTRVAAGVGSGPPPEWLGGYYLANATEFPGVPAFWTAYADMIDELDLRDADHFQAAVEGVAERHAPEAAALLEGYLQVRYTHAEPERRFRYASLARAAATALELHAFLEDHESDLQHTPAVGMGVPDDPVLELGAADPAIRRELNRRLDVFFDHLYRARGGGAPHPEGIQAELFPEFEPF